MNWNNSILAAHFPSIFTILQILLRFEEILNPKSFTLLFMEGIHEAIALVGPFEPENFLNRRWKTIPQVRPMANVSTWNEMECYATH